VGAGSGIGNFGILGLQGALWGPEVESGISESYRFARRAGGRKWNREFRKPVGLQGERCGAKGGLGREILTPPPPPKALRAPPRSARTQQTAA